MLEGRSHSETRVCFGSEVGAAGGKSGSNSAFEDVAGAGLDSDFVGGTARCPEPLSGHSERLNFGPELHLLFHCLDLAGAAGWITPGSCLGVRATRMDIVTKSVIRPDMT